MIFQGAFGLKVVLGMIISNAHEGAHNKFLLTRFLSAQTKQPKRKPRCEHRAQRTNIRITEEKPKYHRPEYEHRRNNKQRNHHQPVGYKTDDDQANDCNADE